MKTVLITLVIIGLLASIIPINCVIAGDTTLPAFSLQNTRIQTSFSYPDMISWEDNISFPITLFITFENQSITYASIWNTKVRLVEATSNPIPTDPPTLYSYAIRVDQAIDPFFEPLYEVINPTESRYVARLNFNITDFSWVSVLKNSVEAKIFFEISLTLVATDGSRYATTIYTTADKQPIITIQSETTEPNDTNGDTFPWSSVAIIVLIIAICLLAIFIIYNRRKTQKLAA